MNTYPIEDRGTNFIIKLPVFCGVSLARQHRYGAAIRRVRISQRTQNKVIYYCIVWRYALNGCQTFIMAEIEKHTTWGGISIPDKLQLVKLLFKRDRYIL